MVVHTVIVGYHERIAVDIYRKTFDFIEDETAMSLEVGKKARSSFFLTTGRELPSGEETSSAPTMNESFLILAACPI